MHFARNLLAHVPKAQADYVAAAFRTIFAQATPAEVDAAWEKTREEFAARFPKLGPLMDDAKVEVLAFTGGTVDQRRFRDADDPWPGHWRQDAVPAPFPATPEGSVLSEELIDVARRELEKLPERQRMVVTMRDMLDFDSAEVCELLGVTMANQRVLLHRGRAAVRQVLEDYLKDPR